MSEERSWTFDAFSLMDPWARFQITLVCFSLTLLQASFHSNK